MQDIYVLMPDDYSNPIVFTSKIAVRKFMEKNNFKYGTYKNSNLETVTNKLEIVDADGNRLYQVISSLAYNSKDVEQDFI